MSHEADDQVDAAQETGSHSADKGGAARGSLRSKAGQAIGSRGVKDGAVSP
jgi:hypothetical protein